VLRYSMKEIEKAFIAFEPRPCRLMAGKERARRKKQSSYFPFFTEY